MQSQCQRMHFIDELLRIGFGVQMLLFHRLLHAAVQCILPCAHHADQFIPNGSRPVVICMKNSFYFHPSMAYPHAIDSVALYIRKRTFYNLKMKSETIQSYSRAPGRPRQFDMDQALDRAVRIFSERGYHATSITDLTQAMELTAGSIYKAFADKRAVFIAALERQMTLRLAELRSELNHAGSGRDKIRAALKFYADASHGGEGRLGCLVVGTAMELSTFDADIAERVTGSLRAREKLIAELIRIGQADGSIAAVVDIKATARCLLCLMQGLRVMGKTTPTRNEMLATVEVAMKMLD